uniref:Calponin-homology (CH) domain-containing protein n=1 Tax=Mola mola TaxID=94237 RepID=A0A3Q3WJF8_MOLML
MDRELNEEELQDLYAWIDNIPLSRPKRHITRDFSDGVMAAEVVKYFFPKLVDLHNYVPANSTQQKLSNWNHLSRKVFSKLNFHVPEETVKRIVLSTAGVIEPVLNALREMIQKKQECTAEHFLVCTACFLQVCEVQQTVQFHRDMEPVFQQMLQEKEQAVMALQETVEILQMKVNRLEHLVHLKDMRIEDLMRHLETYKAKGNTC